MTIESTWTTEAGYSAAVVKHNEMGHYCGYVGLPSSHPLHGKDYDDLPDIDVHGGVTYSEDHLPYGESDGLWYFGFDCAHAGDLVPGMHMPSLSGENVFRDHDYVAKECESLATQLKMLEGGE